MTVVPSNGRAELREQLVARLLQEQPGRVLDVGCGEGGVLAALRRAGVDAVGIEADEGGLRACVQDGLRVVRAHAEVLPFATGAFDWVVLRHVLHHLARPVVAVAEAARVARTGILLAEPWRDPAAPGWALGARLDDWLRRQDRRLGRVHGDDLSPHGLVELLPDGRWSVRHTRCVASEAAPLAAVVREFDARLTGLAPDDVDRAQRDDLLAEARAAGLPRPGSTLLVARRR
ncbi:MAG: methyltransferase domain-containing protein [Planctomycetes bacterium]|nr:methyltransferase domain-containing protein [Planctomycetota bacterium]